MKKIFKLLIVTMPLIILSSCTDSNILEENTKEIGLSKYKVDYKYLSSDFFKEGTLFEPLYVKDNEFYGLTNLYLYSGTMDKEDTNNKYKINENGEFIKYENEIIDNYLEDWQIRSDIKNKSIYGRGMHIDDNNYYYSDFEKDELKEIAWIKDYYEKIEEKKMKIKENNEKTKPILIDFKDNNFVIYEFNSKGSYDREDESLKDLPNYKFTYYIDIEEEVVYISDVIEEEPSINYYYSPKEEAFIKIKEGGTSEKLIFENKKIIFEDYEINLASILKEYDVIPKNYFVNSSFKDYVVIEFLGEKSLYNSIIIDKKTNEINLVKEETFLDENYIDLTYSFINSNYFLSIREEKSYIGLINDTLNLELISEIDLNLEIYDFKLNYPDIKIFPNENGDRFLIILSEFNLNKEIKNAYSKIQYILVDIKG